MTGEEIRPDRHQRTQHGPLWNSTAIFVQSETFRSRPCSMHTHSHEHEYAHRCTFAPLGLSWFLSPLIHCMHANTHSHRERAHLNIICGNHMACGTQHGTRNRVGETLLGDGTHVTFVGLGTLSIMPASKPSLVCVCVIVHSFAICVCV